jgi:ABC-2 type transport system ATP-binding protein
VPVLALDQIKKSYGKVQALKGVSFSVPEGSVFGILGPNGSGKTTLLSVVLDVLSADAGTFRWFNEENTNDARKKIGSLLETPNFYHYLSAVNNLKITQQISGRGNRSDIDRVLEKVNLHQRKHSRFSTYSLGMKQRLAIAAALLGDPGVLVLDEPTNGLDPVGIAEIRSLIVELRQKGHTIIMASHLLDEVEKVCSHVAILKFGTLVVSGAVDTVLTDDDIVEVRSENLTTLQAALRQRFPGAAITETNGYVQLTLPKGTANLADINSMCFSDGVVLDHLYLRKQRLETKFFELTNN